MQTRAKTGLLFMFIFSLVLPLMGQTSERPGCGQNLFEQNWAIPIPAWSPGKTTKHSALRTPLVVPVVVHVVWHTFTENISDELIASQLEALNRDFNAQNQDLDQVPDEFQERIASVGISFCLASKNPDGQPTNGIIRSMTQYEEIGIRDSLFFDSTGGSSAWDTQRYLNIWVANTGKFIAGYGTYPGLTPSYKTGVIINPKYFGQNEHPKYGMGRTLVHETGHYFGLKHLWASDPQCEADDSIEDTPRQQHEHIGCPDYPQPSCTASDMFMNYMDYVDDPCMLLFTAGQKEKIWVNIETYRPTLLTNNAEYYCFQYNIESEPKFIITPNPVSEVLTLIFQEQEAGLIELQIFDLLGRLRMHTSTLVNKSLELEVRGLEAGMYVVKIGEKSQTFIKI